MSNSVGDAAFAVVVIALGICVVVTRTAVERWSKSVGIDMSSPSYRLAYVLGGLTIVVLGVLALISVFMR